LLWRLETATSPRNFFADLLDDLRIDHDGRLDALHRVGGVDRRLYPVFAERKTRLELAEGIAVSMAGDSVAAGQVRLQHSVIRYADHPRLFWAAVAGIAATGVAVLGTGIWLLFFKA
jgi:hypothetical protein